MKTFILVMTMLFLFANTAFASLLTFLGEDEGLGNNIRLPGHPNADAKRLDFLSHLSTEVGTEDFEGFTPGTTPTNINFPGAGSASFSGAAQIVSLPDPTSTNADRYPISGTKYLDFLGTAKTSVTFTEQISAFGFYGTDFGDQGGHVRLETFLNNVSTNVFEISSKTGVPGNVIYFGFIDSNPFDTVEFNNSATGREVFGFDDFTIGTIDQVEFAENSPVPEPATFFLVGFGLLGLGALKRRFFH